MAPREPSGDPVRDLLDEKTLASEITKAIQGNDCPADEELKAYGQGELKEADRIEVKSHLTYCSRCQKRLSQLLGKSPPAPDKAPSLEAGGRFRRLRLALPLSPSKAWGWRVAAAAGAVLAVGTAVFLFWPKSGDRFPPTATVLRTPGHVLRRGQEIFVEIGTSRPIYLIEITIEGDGRIAARVAPGPREGMFSDRDRLALTPRSTGELDLYLVPCPAGEGYPHRLLNGLLEFLKTETAISRSNQRNGIKVALSLYRAKFLHQVLEIDA